VFNYLNERTREVPVNYPGTFLYTVVAL